MEQPDSDRAAWEAIGAAIARIGGGDGRITAREPVGGGCIGAAWSLRTAGGDWFVKLGPGDPADEADGLQRLATCDALRTPQVHAHGRCGDTGWLLLERIELRRRDPRCDERLGRALAELHRITATRFGLERDNRIGATAQPNGRLDDWATFWRERRIGFQLRLAADHGVRFAAGERLLGRIDDLLDGHRPVPSLLHGDLWSGNAAADADGVPVLFDPAVWFGDRECDLAMAELFGGFDDRFDAAYREAWPLDAGYPRRRDLYQLYHVLNHVNLFGGGYVAQAERLIGRLLAAA